MTLISAKNISLKYKNSKTPALDAVSFDILEGRITQFLGRSGSGKTTLLKCVANLISHFTGDILFKNSNVKSMTAKDRASNIGYVSQSFDLFPHMRVLENCMHPQVHVLGRDMINAKKIAQEKLEHLGMGAFLERYPRELSGGQKQRVSIARALCMNSQLLLLDEPTSALDPESSKKLLDILQLLNKEGVTIALSTHDMSFSKNLFDRVYFMENGRVVEFFDAQVQELSQTSALKGFFEH